MSAPAPPPKPQGLAPLPPTVFKKGDTCQAKWSGDGQYYNCRVDAVMGNKYLVNYVEFGNSEWKQLAELK